LVVFLVIGIAAGSEGLGGIPFDNYPLGYRIGTIALALILFDGGLNTSRDNFRAAARPALVLATLGVVITAAIVALAGLVLGLSLPIAVLVGAVVSSTDAAAVFSVLRGLGVRLKPSISAVVEVESGLNDPMAVLLTAIATEFALGAHGGVLAVAWMLLLQLVVGVAAGWLMGRGGAVLLRAVRLPAAGLYPVFTIGVALASFGLATLCGGSGFLAVYLAGILMASSALPYRAGVRRVHDALAWLSQIVMFLMLGLLVFPSRLLPGVPVGLALAAVLALVARPLAVFVSLAPFAFARRETAFIAWAGLRGAVPIILATYPALLHVPEGDQIFHLVFFIVVLNSFVPGATLSLAARRLGIASGRERRPPASVELVSLREFPGDFVWYHVHRASAVAGASVRDLPLPEGCTLSIVLRGDRVVAPRGATVLQVGDHVCLFVVSGHRGLLALLFGASAESA
jgi:potassium/hydrogen antiporter